ncbi:thiol:disulfide interchange protein DsbD [Vibrio paracholerae 87395]|nr:thiol:disulfide interchange protein DsbD [Vibrio paracholerae 87395]QAV06711.1 thiol:disulfide interchange protein DsbD [Vibrio cholerae]
MYLVLQIQCYCLIEMLSLRGVNVAGSSRFEQFGAFTYRLKVCRQLSIALRCLMKRQCVWRCIFQTHCLIELLCSCVVSLFVGEGFHIG